MIFLLRFEWSSFWWFLGGSKKIIWLAHIRDYFLILWGARNGQFFGNISNPFDRFLDMVTLLLSFGAKLSILFNPIVYLI